MPKKKENLPDVVNGKLDAIDYGIVDKNGIPVVSSRHIAKVFEKRHDHVLRDINNIKANLPEIGEVDFEQNFIETTYKDSKGRTYKEYLLTRDGFVLVAMGFTGKKALQFKIEYIRRFNEMEEKLESLKIAKMEFPQLTEAIKEAYDDPQFYHFSNELNMINRIVLGMSAKEFRKLHNIKKGASIRPYLTAEQISLVEKLQRFDIGLLATVPDFKKRKEMLTQYYNRLIQTKSIAGNEANPQ